jgi:dTDP-4-dehydrorhamnose 3,5-epimerase
MKFLSIPLAGLFVIEPEIFNDGRGYFFEVYHSVKFSAAGITEPFVQDNHSRSTRGTLRGLHFQTRHPQGKLIRALQGEIFDVAVDLRPDSPTFKLWYGINLSSGNHRQLYVPVGFAHGFCVLSESAEIEYKCTDIYDPEYQVDLIWNDPDISVKWPISDPVLSAKDQKGKKFKEIEPELNIFLGKTAA